MPLTAKQQRFVEEYCVDWNATQAAIRAGYSEKTAALIGHENLRKPNVAAAIQVFRTNLAERSKVDAEWIANRLKVEALRDGENATHGARVRAVELLGKLLGLLSDKLDVTSGGRRIPMVSVLSMTGLSDDDANDTTLESQADRVETIHSDADSS